MHEAVKVSYLPRRDAGSPLSASLSVCEVEAKDRRSAGAAELVPAVELECSVFLGPWFLVVSGCVFLASQLVFDLVGGAVAER